MVAFLVSAPVFSVRPSVDCVPLDTLERYVPGFCAQFVKSLYSWRQFPVSCPARCGSVGPERYARGPPPRTSKTAQWRNGGGPQDTFGYLYKRLCPIWVCPSFRWKTAARISSSSRRLASPI